MWSDGSGEAWLDIDVGAGIAGDKKSVSTSQMISIDCEDRMH